MSLPGSSKRATAGTSRWAMEIWITDARKLKVESGELRVSVQSLRGSTKFKVPTYVTRTEADRRHRRSDEGQGRHAAHGAQDVEDGPDQSQHRTGTRAGRRRGTAGGRHAGQAAPRLDRAVHRRPSSRPR